MNEVKWIDLVPSIMSAIASVGSAVAAFWALRISKQAKVVSEQSALATHHGSAALEFTKAVEQLKRSSNDFSEVAYRTWADWASEIGGLDHREAGGSNARPLRHVLTDASEMLVKHGVGLRPRYIRAARSMFSIIRDGVNNLNDAEYEQLLKRADGKYCDFGGIFGEPPLDRCITTAPAFRWACYQLNKRIDKNIWIDIWEKAWQANGWLNNFRSEHNKIKPALASILTSLNSEKAKLGHTVFPLKSNPTLYWKYDDLVSVVEVLLDDCSLDLVEGYWEHPHKDDVIQLIVYSMGIAFLVVEALGSVQSLE